MPCRILLSRPHLGRALPCPLLLPARQPRAQGLPCRLLLRARQSPARALPCRLLLRRSLVRGAALLCAARTLLSAQVELACCCHALSSGFFVRRRQPCSRALPCWLLLPRKQLLPAPVQRRWRLPLPARGGHSRRRALPSRLLVRGRRCGAITLCPPRLLLSWRDRTGTLQAAAGAVTLALHSRRARA